MRCVKQITAIIALKKSQFWLIVAGIVLFAVLGHGAYKFFRAEKERALLFDLKAREQAVISMFPSIPPKGQIYSSPQYSIFWSSSKYENINIFGEKCSLRPEIENALHEVLYVYTIDGTSFRIGNPPLHGEIALCTVTNPAITLTEDEKSFAVLYEGNYYFALLYGKNLKRAYYDIADEQFFLDLLSYGKRNIFDRWDRELWEKGILGKEKQNDFSYPSHKINLFTSNYNSTTFIPNQR